jgi:hypothetical protein
MVDLKSDDVDGDLWIWKWFLKFLKRLGEDGMSSDESDMEGRESVYRVRTMTWRREEVEEYMDLIDEQPNVDREIFTQQGSIGYRRVRGPYNPPSTREPVTQLPRQFYDDEWLENQTTRYRHSTLKVSGENFQLLDIQTRK